MLKKQNHFMNNWNANMNMNSTFFFVNNNTIGQKTLPKYTAIAKQSSQIRPKPLTLPKNN